MPSFTPPAPYSMEDNPDSLLDKSDLVFINPVGTGYSAAIAPNKNRDFWGVDQDANSIKQFIKRFLTKNNRWNSPKYPVSASRTARRAVACWPICLHEDGVDLNGITLQSSILDYTQVGQSGRRVADRRRGRLVSQETRRRADADRISARSPKKSRNSRAPTISAALRKFPPTDPATVEKLSEYTGIDKATLLAWSLDIAGVRQPRQFAVPDHAAEVEGARARRI